LQRISRALPIDIRVAKFLYFPAFWLFAVHAARNPPLLWADKRDFIYKAKSRSEVVALVARSRIVVDIERPVQCGYTMRTLETLGAGRKLITTNAEVINSDFYVPDNIAIIDRNSPRISAEFFTSVYQPVPPKILYRYSLEGWLDEVLPTS
jgi:hypothetical protein